MLCEYNMQVSLNLKTKGVCIIYQSFVVVFHRPANELISRSIFEVKTNVKYYMWLDYLVILKVNKLKNNLHGLTCKFRDAVQKENKILKNHGIFFHLINIIKNRWSIGLIYLIWGKI